MKTRFAPSPTGYIHLGNVRTALFCALLARKEQGTFLLRIEDTDQLRSGDEFAEQLQYDLQWLGLDWQEGPHADKGHGPYYQSQRQGIYASYFDQLEQQKLAYPCFCSEQELAIMRKVQLSAGQPPRYAGTCRNLAPEQIAEKIAAGLKPTLRFHVPDHQIIEFTDYVRGPQRYVTTDIGDFVIRRGDGTAAFFFCNAIDDAMMEVTHVLRGEDHLTNTPRQLMILQALQLFQPQYGHMAMIVGPDGSPLSKRHGSRSIKVLHKQGYLPIALVNYLARLGHYYEQNNLMSLSELATNFSISHLGKAPARFDEAQLHYWQKLAVQQMSSEEFWNWLGEDIQKIIPENQKALFIEAIQKNVCFPEEAKHWAEIFFGDELVYNDEALTILKQTPAEFFDIAMQTIDQHGVDFKILSQTLQEKLNIKGKALFHPLRIALSGQADGPEMAKLMELLGALRITNRFKNSKTK